MIKKLIAQLAGFFEQRSDAAKKFHQQEDIERELARERAKDAQERERERLQSQMEQRPAPTAEEVTGPSESREA